MRENLFCICVMLGTLLLASCTPQEKPDDGSVDDNPDKVKTYKVGDIYDNGFIRGMVFLTDETGEHGTIISLKDTSAVWSYVEEEPTGSFPQDGLYNTRAVYKMPNWRDNYPGFLWCYKMNVMGIDRWFIPNPYELYQLYEVYSSDSEGFNAMLDAAGGEAIKDVIYWTSSEYGPSVAQPFDMNIGDNIFQDMEKRNVYHFRAFCKF